MATRTSTKQKEEVVLEPATPPAAIVGKMVSGKWNGKYDIFDPRQVKYVERTDFLKRLCGQIDQGDTLEDSIIKSLRDKAHRSVTESDILELAQTYYKYRNKGARLPKFSRWVTGMFASNAEYANYLAAEGQKAAARKIIMSVDLVDILRNADTPHFSSCFRKRFESPDVDQTWAMKNYEYPAMQSWDAFQYMGVRIAEDCPGIGLLYVDDEKGHMMGRLWVHHARNLANGEDLIVLPQSQYGCLQGSNVARLLANRGIKVALGSYYGAPPNNPKIDIEYVGCFTKQIHHDLTTWGQASHKVQLVQPAF